ncbi:MAG: DNA-deoxyinosine glycosylase [Clostridia bacterium]|nr:DNA-deoxyinosine glycosylase [Clostridia bacterium]
MKTIVHPFPPYYDENSEILILGSFPSVKSREEMFFYGHPQNRFWKVISAVTESDIPVTIEQKKELLLRNKIALWDVIASCEIEGSSDSSIKNVVPNDISGILKNSKVKKIYVNGKTAEKYYNKYIKEKIGMSAICLPSTSPANAKCTLEKLISEWKKNLSE